MYQQPINVYSKPHVNNNNKNINSLIISIDWAWIVNKNNSKYQNFENPIFLMPQNLSNPIHRKGKKNPSIRVSKKLVEANRQYYEQLKGIHKHYKRRKAWRPIHHRYVSWASGNSLRYAWWSEGQCWRVSEY